jgi:hypothetical protein
MVYFTKLKKKKRTMVRGLNGEVAILLHSGLHSKKGGFAGDITT